MRWLTVNRTFCDQCNKEIGREEDKIHLRVEFEGRTYFKDLHTHCFRALMGADIKRLVGGENEGKVD